MSNEIVDLLENNISEADEKIKKLDVMLEKQAIFGREVILLINSGIAEANKTESIDERINLLVTCLSDINKLINLDFKNMTDLKTKADAEKEVLTKVLSEAKKKDEEESANSGVQQEWTD